MTFHYPVNIHTIQILIITNPLQICITEAHHIISLGQIVEATLFSQRRQIVKIHVNQCQNNIVKQYSIGVNAIKGYIPLKWSHP